MRRLAAALALAAASFGASATTVMVMSIGPGRVELLVNGAVVRSLRPGETSPEGVRLVEIGPQGALLEVDGRRWQMALGSSTSSSVVLQADARGHFFANAMINGVPVRSLVDTGASAVSLNLADAQRLGVNLAGAQRIAMHTAGGVRQGLRVKLAVVQLGDIVLRDVEATVSVANELPIVLLGMSFLNQVEMQRSGGTLTLTRRH
ncbi:MAG: TIGR02281 family clan AA aspartic protease [Betaproteobacteria bacterium]